MKGKRVLTSLAVTLSICLEGSASASTFVAMSEEELVEQSEAALIGSVVRIVSVGDEEINGVHTLVFIHPDRVLFGDVPEDEVILREIGGRLGERIEWIYGSPQYRVGEEVLVFVDTAPDGSLRTTSMAMGKFSLHHGSNGSTVATRDLGEGAALLDPATGHSVTDPAPEERDLALFAQRIASLGAERRHRTLAHGRPRSEARQPGAEEISEETDSFTYLGSPSRWFEADDGDPVAYGIDSTGDAKIGPAHSRAAVDDALAAWSNVPSSSLELADGGLIVATPYAGCENGNRIVFNDPFNEISDPTHCGGVLAIGGYCASSETRVVNGTTFRRIITGKIMFNNGWSNCSGWNLCDLSEVATHELGHTIGLGHSSDQRATMAAMAHFDGRCAGLRADDVAAATFVYPNVVGTVTTPTITPTPTLRFTRTPMFTRTGTPTRRFTPTKLPTRTPTRASTPTRTPTRSLIATRTNTAAPSETGTGTPTLAWTATGTPADPFEPTPDTPQRHEVRGRVRYYLGGNPVPAARMHLRGAEDRAVETAADGLYSFSQVARGAWELTAEKEIGYASAVSALDAVYVLQAVARTRVLSAAQRLACDVTGDGRLSALDAVRVLQYSVGLIPRLPIAEVCRGDWAFLPGIAVVTDGCTPLPPHIEDGYCRDGKIMLDDLEVEAAGQDFEALLFGDCTGNWETEAPSGQPSRRVRPAARLRVGRPRRGRGHTVRASLYVRSSEPVHSLTVTLAYDPDRLAAPTVTARRAAREAMLVTNGAVPGRLVLAMASRNGFGGRKAALADVTFTASATAKSLAPVTALEATVDEKPALTRSRLRPLAIER